MRERSITWHTTVGATAGLALGVALLVSIPAASALLSTSPSASHGVALLTQEQNATLPTVLEQGDLGEQLRPESVRHAGDHDGVSYWIALDERDEICVVGYVPGTYWFAASTCVHGAQFSMQGAGIRGEGSGVLFEAYLVPDGAAVPEWVHRVTENIAVADGSTGIETRARSVNPSDTGFVLATFPRPHSSTEVGTR